MLETNTLTDVVEVTFPAGLPGFPSSRRFRVEPWGPAGSPFLLMSAVDNPEIGFVIVPPWVFYPDYEFELDAPSAIRIAISLVCVAAMKPKTPSAASCLSRPWRTAQPVAHRDGRHRRRIKGASRRSLGTPRMRCTKIVPMGNASRTESLA